MPTGGYCGLPLAAAACHRVAAPPSPLERVSNMRMRDVQEEEQRRTARAVHTSKEKYEQQGRAKGGTRARAQSSAMRDCWARGVAVLAGRLGTMGAVCAGLGASAETGPRRGHQAAWAGRQST